MKMGFSNFTEIYIFMHNARTFSEYSSQAPHFYGGFPLVQCACEKSHHVLDKNSSHGVGLCHSQGKAHKSSFYQDNSFV